jgi:hypothetical protein
MSLNLLTAHDLDSTIRCHAAQGRPIAIAELRQARDAEAASTGARVTIIKLLEREIRRQERAK